MERRHYHDWTNRTDRATYEKMVDSEAAQMQGRPFDRQERLDFYIKPGAAYTKICGALGCAEKAHLDADGKRVR